MVQFMMIEAKQELSNICTEALLYKFSAIRNYQREEETRCHGFAPPLPPPIRSPPSPLPCHSPPPPKKKKKE